MTPGSEYCEGPAGAVGVLVAYGGYVVLPPHVAQIVGAGKGCCLQPVKNRLLNVRKIKGGGDFTQRHGPLRGILLLRKLSLILQKFRIQRGPLEVRRKAHTGKDQEYPNYRKVQP